MIRFLASLSMRRLFGIVLSVTVLLASSLSHANNVIVTRNDDTPLGTSPQFGSLRDAIENRASPGDTIVFDVKGPITLVEDLTIPVELADLTIQGKVIIRAAKRSSGVVVVKSDNVTIDNITFQNMSLLVSDSRRIQGFNLRNSRFRQKVEIFIDTVENCFVAHNNIVTTISEPQAAAVVTVSTRNCLLYNNMINATSAQAYSISDQSSSGLQVFDNTIEKGDVVLRAISGEVRRNVIGGQIQALQTGSPGPFALLAIENNEADSILARRSFINLIENTLDGSTLGVSGPGNALTMNNDDPAGPQGPILIEKNIITGGRNGITYSETKRGAPAVIRDNQISGCQIRGILVNSAQDVKVSGNEVSMCGSNGAGRGIAIGRAGAGGLVVEKNIVTEIDGTGFLVTPQTTGNSVLLKDNTSKENTRTGMFLSANTSDLFGLIRLEGNIVSGNGDAGVVAQPNSRAVIVGGEIKDNRASGVRVNTGAKVSVSQVSMGANDGPGIDITPEGVTPNAETKNGNSDIDWPENLSISPASQKLEGTAAPGSIVEIFVVESGERLGNPENGEGAMFIGSATAATDGTFVYPENGAIQCPESRLITLTATLHDGEAVTSEFSPDFVCVIPDGPPVTDDDGDGVDNAIDQCPNTPAGEAADADGCAESQKDDDGDGVSNADDQCPATPAGEGADADGCGESQKDDDDDGVSNADDKCPGPGDPATSGCVGEIFIPGLGTIFLNDLALSSINIGANGESCSDCSIDLVDSTAHFCFAAGSFVITGPTAIRSDSCSYVAPAFSIDGTGAVISSNVGNSVACEGGLNQCEVISDDPNLAGSCADESCVKWFRSDVTDYFYGTYDFSLVVVRKTTLAGDGDFAFVVESNGVGNEFTWEVSTTNGIGDTVAELNFGNREGELTIRESDFPGWSESVLCNNDTTGDSVGGESSVIVPPVAGEIFSTWSCNFQNTVFVDSDGDGIPDDIDRCSNPGTGGNECPEQGDNGFAAWYCNDALTCSFTPTEGDCSDCVIERLDETASISCPPDGVCVLRDDRVLQCPAGGCSYTTPNLSGSCAPGSLCTHDIGFSCQTDVGGNGCDGTFASTGESLACPAAQVCEIEVTPNLLTEAASLTAVVDILKSTEGGDGSFDFDWLYSSTVVFATGLAMYEGQFSIATQGGVGESIARFYVEPVLGTTRVAERASGDFVLNRVDCDPVSGAIALSEADLPAGQIGGVLVQNQHTCTFVNVLEAAQPDRVAPIPDGMVQPDGVGNAAPGAFGGQMNTTNPVVGIGTGSSEIFVDVVTGEVPRAGNDRLSFTGTGFASFGVLVQPNDEFPGFDTVRSSGAGTVAYQFDPNTGAFGFGALGFNTIIDLLHLGNDNTSSALLSVNRSLNQIDVLSPPASSGLGNLDQFTVTSQQHLNDVAGQLVSAQAYSLGRLDCFNPCQESGQPMPAGCSAEIDAVIATPGFEFCADFWTPSCASQYSSQNDNFCALPFDQRQVSFGGSLLVLTDGTPGQIHLGNPALDFFGRVQTIGNVGNDPRRVRCLAGICAVSNNGSNSLTILTWDGATNAAITDTIAVGAGPIGLDLRQVGDNVVILSTGSNDDTYTKTTVSPSGLVLASDTLPMLDGCTGPGHIIWVDNSTKAFASCFSSNSYAVFDP